MWKQELKGDGEDLSEEDYLNLLDEIKDILELSFEQTRMFRKLHCYKDK
jgi:hypothetical protein